MKKILKGSLLLSASLLLISCEDIEEKYTETDMTAGTTTTLVTKQYVGNISLIASNTYSFIGATWEAPILLSENPSKGDEIYLGAYVHQEEAEIENGLYSTFRYKITCDGTEIESRSLLTSIQEPLISAKLDTSSLDTGIHTVKFIVDPDDELSETNENDNEITLTFTLD